MQNKELKPKNTDMEENNHSGFNSMCSLKEFSSMLQKYAETYPNRELNEIKKLFYDNPNRFIARVKFLISSEVSTVTDVSYTWYDFCHAHCKRAGIPFDDFKEMSRNIASAMAKYKNAYPNRDHNEIKILADDSKIHSKVMALEADDSLTIAQVNNEWFDFGHLACAELKLKYDIYARVSSKMAHVIAKYAKAYPNRDHNEIKILADDSKIHCKVEALEADDSLTIAQVNNEWFDLGHLACAELKLKYDIYARVSSKMAHVIAKYANAYPNRDHNEIKILADNFKIHCKVEALEADDSLTIAQVNNEWFDLGHLACAELKLQYPIYASVSSNVAAAIAKYAKAYPNRDHNEIKILADNFKIHCKVEALEADDSLTIAQVNNEWFDLGHLACAELKIPYFIYENTSEDLANIISLYLADLYKINLLRTDENLKKILSGEIKHSIADLDIWEENVHEHLMSRIKEKLMPKNNDTSLVRNSMFRQPTVSNYNDPQKSDQQKIFF